MASAGVGDCAPSEVPPTISTCRLASLSLLLLLLLRIAACLCPGGLQTGTGLQGATDGRHMEQHLGPLQVLPLRPPRAAVP